MVVRRARKTGEEMMVVEPTPEVLEEELFEKEKTRLLEIAETCRSLVPSFSTEELIYTTARINGHTQIKSGIFAGKTEKQAKLWGYKLEKRAEIKKYIQTSIMDAELVKYLDIAEMGLSDFHNLQTFVLKKMLNDGKPDYKEINKMIENIGKEKGFIVENKDQGAKNIINFYNNSTDREVLELAAKKFKEKGMLDKLAATQKLLAKYDVTDAEIVK